MNLKKEYIHLTSHTRLYGLDCPIIGLTGGIASGKTTVSTELKRLGHLVICADQLVKKIYSTSEAKKFIHNLCPNTLIDDKIDFKALRKTFFNDKPKQMAIETFIYERLEKFFLAELAGRNDSLIFYDAPLLFEKKLNPFIDIVICIGCSESLQAQRLIRRDHIDEELAKKILKKQLSLSQKMSQADFTILNNGEIHELPEKVQKLLKQLEADPYPLE